MRPEAQRVYPRLCLDGQQDEAEAGKATGVAPQGLRSGAAEKKALGASHLAVEANE